MIRKAIVFDTGPFISLTLNGLLWILEPLKRQFGGEFYITQSVKEELVDKPLRIKRFMFEAMQILKLIDDGVIKVTSDVDLERSKKLLDIANHSYRCKSDWLTVVHPAEVESLSAAISLKADAYVVDERTMRMIVESPKSLGDVLQSKLHSSVDINPDNVQLLSKETSGIKMIRSVELMVVAYELGLLDRYLPNIKGARKMLLDSVLWGAKLNGCAISGDEIDKILLIEGKRK